MILYVDWTAKTKTGNMHDGTKRIKTETECRYFEKVEAVKTHTKHLLNSGYTEINILAVNVI